MAETMAAVTKDELNALALTLAYDFGTSNIETKSLNVSEASGQGGDWFEIDPAGESIKDCVLYLEARELLVRHPDNPNWVTMFDESEATA